MSDMVVNPEDWFSFVAAHMLYLDMHIFHQFTSDYYGYKDEPYYNAIFGVHRIKQYYM